MKVSLNELFHFVLFMTKKYNIDSSHSEGHSMNVLHYADEIYRRELLMFPYLKNQTNVIYTASVLHDMCDKKYMNQDTGLQEIQTYLKYKLNDEEIYFSKRIMETMSYSTVKKYGYPDLGEYQIAYHIVREADLLTSYDFDRAMIYHLNKGNDLTSSYYNSLHLFENRVFNYNTDKLLLSDYAQQTSMKLTISSLKRMLAWNKILLR